jgi:hypothetical protein
MRKITLLALAAAGVLAFAGTAQAKEVVSLKICGPSGCNSSTDREALRGWEAQSSTNPESVSYTNPQSFYTIELGFGDPEGNVIHRETAYWLPDAGLMRFTSQRQEPWWTISPNQAEMYRDVAAGVEAFTPSLSRVTVAGKPVSDPTSYLRLMGNFRSVFYPKGKLHLTRIVLRSAERNPWVDRTEAVSYDAKRRLLIRSDGYFRLPAAIGKLVMKRASLATSSSTTSSSGSGKTGLYAGVGAGLVVALGVLAVAGRKRIR